MKRLILAKLGLGAAVALTLPLVAAEDTRPSKSPAHAAPGSSGNGLDSFRILFERNIFNPNRSSRSSEPELTQREPERRVRTESFALVGTMTSENGRFAFFDSSSPDYRKVLRATEVIAGYTIASVTPDHVTLQSTNEGDITVPVGMGLQRQEEGKWTLSARTEGSNQPTSSSSGTENAGSGAGGEADEILRRMMQRREQEGGANAGANPLTASPPAPPPTSPAASSSAGEDEIVRRMLEKREQELKK